MPSFTESNITLNFPDENYFRLGQCDWYKKNQNNFAEMDFCWFDQQNDILYLIELKDWKNNLLNEETDPTFTPDQIQKIKKNISNYRIENLLKKSVDSVCMFMSVLLDTKNGREIKQCSPFEISSTTKIKLLSIINWIDADSTYITNINTKYKSKFGSYAKLFGIKSFLVLTKDKASEILPWIT